MKIQPIKHDKSRRKTIAAILYVLLILLLLLIMSFIVSSIQQQQQDEQQIISTTTKHNNVNIMHDELNWSDPYIHIVNTRFAQDQGHLLHLANARYELFKAFCFPTMTHQSIFEKYINNNNNNITSSDINNSIKTTSPPFLWFIKIDPELDKSILQKLITLVQQYPNIYIIGSNNNFGIGIHPSGFRGGESGSDILYQSTIYAGDVRWVHVAHRLRTELIIIETRLDADDGLHTTYLERIQSQVLHDMISSKEGEDGGRGGKNKKWMYYCTRYSIEWLPSSSSSSSNNDNTSIGNVQWKGDRICLTGGLTLALNVHIKEQDVPRSIHSNLIQYLSTSTICLDHSHSPCLLQMNEPISIVRSRTFTSAGMKGIATITESDNSDTNTITKEEQNIWNILHKDYSIPNVDLIQTLHEYLKYHESDIIRDNLKGQCTAGHSCKLSSKDKLQSMLELLEYKNLNSLKDVT